MTVRELFDFVTDLAITAHNLDAYLERAMTISAERSHEEVSEQSKIDEEVGVDIQSHTHTHTNTHTHTHTHTHTES